MGGRTLHFTIFFLTLGLVLACQIREAGEVKSGPVPFFNIEAVPLSDTRDHYGVKISWTPPVAVTLGKQGKLRKGFSTEKLITVEEGKGEYIDPDVVVDQYYRYRIAEIPSGIEIDRQTLAVKIPHDKDLTAKGQVMIPSFKSNDLLIMNDKRLYAENTNLTFAPGSFDIEVDEIFFGSGAILDLRTAWDEKMQKDSEQTDQAVEQLKAAHRGTYFRLRCKRAVGKLTVLVDGEGLASNTLQNVILDVLNPTDLTFVMKQRGEPTEKPAVKVALGTERFFFEDKQLKPIAPYVGLWADDSTADAPFVLINPNGEILTWGGPHSTALLYVTYFGKTTNDFTERTMARIDPNRPTRRLLPGGLELMSRVSELTYKLEKHLRPAGFTVEFSPDTSGVLFDEDQAKLLSLFIARQAELVEKMRLHQVTGVRVKNRETTNHAPSIEEGDGLVMLTLSPGCSRSPEENFRLAMDAIAKFRRKPINSMP